MLRPFKIALLAMGAVVGYGFAIHGMRHHRSDRDAWEHHIADVCVRAAGHVHGEAPERNREKPKNEAAEP